MRVSVQIVLILTLVELLASACGSSSVSATSGPPSVAKLRSVLVQQSDLPVGYSGTSPPGEASTPDRQIASCVGLKDTSDKDQVQQAQSDDFKMGPVAVSSAASSYKFAADVVNQVAIIKSPRAQSCLNTLLRKEIAKSLPSSKIDEDTLTLDVASSATPNLVGSVQGLLTVSEPARKITVYLDIAIITGRELTAAITLTSIGAKISSSLTNSIVEAVAKRAASA